MTQWSDDLWKGPAIKMGAGVLGYEVTEVGKTAGLVVVGANAQLSALQVDISKVAATRP